MSEDSLHDRGKAMEDLFFHDVDQKLLEQLKADAEADENRESLMSATGIRDANAIQHLVEQGISVETLASVGLIPLVAVAWADGKMEPNEREAVLKAAAESGIDANNACYQLIAGWLNNRPSDALLASWKEYIGALKSSVDGAAFNQIQTSIVERANQVAAAAGGFLGMGSISDVEKNVIAELSAAFN